MQYDKYSTTCFYSFLYSLNKPGLGALLKSLALILQEVEVLEEGCDLIGIVFLVGQELREWLSEVRACQWVSQLESQGHLPGRSFAHGVLLYVKCMLFFLTVNKKGKSMNRETKYSTDF